MEDYESEPMFFTPESLVIVISFDDVVEMGTVIQHDEVGLSMKTTHQMETVHHTATVEQEQIVEEIFADMSSRDLREYAVHEGLGRLRAYTWKTERLRAAAIRYAMSKMEKDIQTLMPMSKPVKQWISSGDVKRVQDAVDFIEHGILSRLDFSPATEYSQIKTETEDPETK